MMGPPARGRASLYAAAAERVRRSVPPRAGLAERMQAAADALWEHLSPIGVSWVGFYLPEPGGGSLLLGPRRDKPACSPIGLHGVCGRALRERRPVVVEDVRELGGSYIACDPADRSEVAVPLLDASGRPWAVLDLDSREVGFFSQQDAEGLRLVLEAAFPRASAPDPIA
jgi:putative methionine-R-sulfoxide reductase with GAF domain